MMGVLGIQQGSLICAYEEHTLPGAEEPNLLLDASLVDADAWTAYAYVWEPVEPEDVCDICYLPESECDCYCEHCDCFPEECVCVLW